MKRLFLCVLLMGISWGCATPSIEPLSEKLNAEEEQTDSSSFSSQEAQVTAVETSGDSGSYSLAVTISSPDAGCDAYADWWEVISLEGELLYRRILAHSHVDEQPFTRSGGPVAAEAGTPIVVRVHMHPSGYSPYAMTGLIGESLTSETLDSAFASNLAEVEPLPSSCAF